MERFHCSCALPCKSTCPSCTCASDHAGYQATQSDLINNMNLDIVQKLHPFGGFIPLSVILYNSEQKSLVRNQPSLTVDKTFRLGTIFVTMTIFENKNFRYAEPAHSGHPVMVGPTLVHTADDLRTYDAFFSHLYQNVLYIPLEFGNEYVLEDCRRISENTTQTQRLMTSLQTFFGDHLRLNTVSKMSTAIRAELKSRLSLTVPGLAGVVEAFEKVSLCQQQQMKSALYDCGELRLSDHMTDDVKVKCGWECSLFNREPADDVMQYLIRRR